MLAAPRNKTVNVRVKDCTKTSRENLVYILSSLRRKENIDSSPSVIINIRPGIKHE